MKIKNKDKGVSMSMSDEGKGKIAVKDDAEEERQKLLMEQLTKDRKKLDDLPIRTFHPMFEYKMSEERLRQIADRTRKSGIMLIDDV